MVLHTCSINLCQRGIETGFFLLSFFKNILSENIFFAKNYQENTTVCLLQPKVLGRNYLWTNNRYIVFFYHFCYFNSFKPGVPFVGHRQSVKPHLGLFCLLGGISLKNEIKIKNHS